MLSINLAATSMVLLISSSLIKSLASIQGFHTSLLCWSYSYFVYQMFWQTKPVLQSRKSKYWNERFHVKSWWIYLVHRVYYTTPFSYNLHEGVWNNFFKICVLNSKHLEKLNTNNFPNIRFDIYVSVLAMFEK